MSFSVAFTNDLSGPPRRAAVPGPPRLALLLGEPPDNLAEICTTLAEHGFRVLVETAASTALVRLDEVDVVVTLGSRTPALQACRAVKRQRPLIPVLVAGIGSEIGAVVTAFDAGADDCLPSPFHPRELALRMEARLRSREAERAVSAAEARFRTLVEQSLVGIYTIQDGRFTYVNPRFAEIFGYTPEQITSELMVWDLVDADDRMMVDESIHRRMCGEVASIRYCFRGRRGNGTVVPVEVHGSRVEIDGRPALIGTLVDISQRRRVEEALLESEQYFRSLIEEAQDMITVLDGEGIVLYESPSVERVLGYTTEELLGRSVFELIHPEDQAPVTTRFGELLAGPDGLTTARLRFLHRDGSYRVLEVTARDLRGEAVGGVVVNSTDVTQRHRAERALEESEERFRLIVEASRHIFFYVHDHANRLDYLSPSVREVLGYEAEELTGRCYDELLNPDGVDRLGRELDGDTAERPGRSLVYTVRVRHRDGRMVTLELVESPLVSDDQVVGVQGFARDVTERVRMEEALQAAAFADPLTGLPNRVLFLERVSHTIARCRRQRDRSFALLFLDLDRFKVINDSLGHEVGDKLLVATAERLRRCLRPEDTIARFGGDEFAVLLEDVTATADATRVAQRILEELSLPLDLDGYEVCTAASIGIVLGGPQHDLPDHVLRNADMAMYRAKAGGGSRYEMFDSEMHAEALGRLQLETDLRQAVERESFCIHYQPVIDLTTGRTVGFEALIRWLHPTRGTVAPSDFIPVAEETGMIIPIGDWVLRTALLQLREWQALTGDDELFVAVNLSARQLGHPDFQMRVLSALRDSGVRPRNVKLEITESVVMDDVDTAARTLNQLKSLGIHILMDDFGTGYSSLSYLHRLPVDGLKIDRSFVGQMEEGARNALLVESVLGLARGLELCAVAEGVETADQAQALAAMGCRYAQGYHFSRPLPAVDATRILQAANGAAAAG